MQVLIVEDVTMVSERIAALCESHINCQDITVAHTLDDAQYHIDHASFDLVFLDLNLNGKDGFDLLSQLKPEPFQVIVITASPEKAVEAFDFGVLDFIAKPITDQRFEKAIQRYLEKKPKAAQAKTSLQVKSKGQLVFISLSHVTYIQASGNYAELHTNKGVSHLLDQTLETLMSQLPETFVRVHRSYIVRKETIVRVKNHGAGKYTAELNSGNLIPVSRGCYKRLFT